MKDFQWAEELDCAVTVCDMNTVVLYMNAKARKTFEKYGDLIGKNLMDCHGEKSAVKIKEMLATGTSNAYTIEKEGKRKMIYQAPWREAGEVKGLVEFSIELPGEMPHFIRG
ncbi:MAG: PAS sensor protein [Bacteroidetes bacterium HGW-Bacteroidetes-14]|jgi:DUF438 domain-containing protein|nr:MAG: PAS sensor protein [Bacteroidetes bacterium HGW-Bacteroidetes-14]